MLKKLVLFFMILMATHLVQGQKKLITITGEIFDRTSSDKISYATISYDDGLRGTSSNDEGIFTLSLSKKYLSDSISIHHLGFELKKIAIQKFTDDRKMSIGLEAVSYRMPEATIRPIDPYKLLDTAFNNIETQFYTDKHILKGFFRESVWHPGMDQLLYLAEGTLLTYKKGYKNNPRYEPLFNSQTKDHIVIDSAYAADIESTFSYKGLEIIVPRIVQGPFSPISLDVFKNPKDFFCSSCRKRINYTYDRYVKKGEDEFYVIKFDDVKLEIDYEGELYYDLNKKVITEVIYSVNNRGLGKFDAGNSEVNLRSRKFHIKYTLMGDKLGLSFVAIHNEFEDRIVGHLIKNEIEYVTNSIETKKVKPFKRKQRIDIDSDLELSLFKTGISKWKNISVIPRTKNMDKLVLNRIIKPLDNKLDKSAISNKILYTNYNKALKLSKNNQKPLLIYFTADWCMPCKKMQNTTFKEKDVVTFINEKYIPVKIDMTRGDNSISRKFGITSMPSYLIVSSDREVVSKTIGYQPSFLFMSFLKGNNIIDHSKWTVKDISLVEGDDKPVFHGTIRDSVLFEEMELSLEMSVKEASMFQLLVIKKDELVEKFGINGYYNKLVESMYTIGNLQFSKSPRHVLHFLKEYAGDDCMPIYFKYLADHYRFSQNIKSSAATSSIQFLSHLQPEYIPEFMDDISFVTSNIKRTVDLQNMQTILNKVLVEDAEIEKHKDFVEEKLSLQN